MNAKMLLIHYPYGLRIVCVKSLSEDFIITKLNEHTTVQRNYPIGSVDLNRNHSSDVLV